MSFSRIGVSHVEIGEGIRPLINDQANVDITLPILRALGKNQNDHANLPKTRRTLEYLTQFLCGHYWFTESRHLANVNQCFSDS